LLLQPEKLNAMALFRVSGTGNRYSNSIVLMASVGLSVFMARHDSQ